MSGSQAVFRLKPEMLPRVVAAFALTTVGMYYLYKGKNEHRPRLMALGALLVMAGLFCL